MNLIKDCYFSIVVSCVFVHYFIALNKATIVLVLFISHQAHNVMITLINATSRDVFVTLFQCCGDVVCMLGY